MDCTSRQEQTSLFIDGELSMSDQVDLFKHLAVCTECQLFLDSLLKWKEIQRRESVQFPAEIDEAVLSGIEQGDAVRRDLPRRNERIPSFWGKRITLPVPMALAVGAALVIAVALLISFVARSPEPDQALRTIFAGKKMPSQPTTIIFLYGLPEVQVVGEASSSQRVEKTLY